MRKAGSKATLGAKLNDEESRGIIYDGASLSQLANIFDLDNREIARKIHGVAPCGERMGYPIYRIKDVAPFLVPPSPDEVANAIKRMSPRDLPAALTKEYWLAQQARANFEEDQGDLWRTSDVMQVFGEVFKVSRMSLLLMRDQVERQTELTEKQRTIIIGLIDGVLGTMRKSLIEKFENDNHKPGNDGWTEASESEDEAL